jgi:carboxyl-terminal processing protease
LSHPTFLDQYKSASDFAARFNSNDLWQDFATKDTTGKYIATQISAEEKNLVAMQLKALLARYKWRNEGYYTVLNLQDKTILAALKNFH